MKFDMSTHDWCDLCETREVVLLEIGEFLVCEVCLTACGYPKLEKMVKDHPDSPYLPPRN